MALIGDHIYELFKWFEEPTRRIKGLGFIIEGFRV